MNIFLLLMHKATSCYAHAQVRDVVEYEAIPVLDLWSYTSPEVHVLSLYNLFLAYVFTRLSLFFMKNIVSNMDRADV